MATHTETLLMEAMPVMSHTHASAEAQIATPELPRVTASRLRKIAVTFQLSGVNFACSATNGLIIVGLPRMTADLHLPASLAFWPSSVQGLATASTLLLAGALADVLGARSVDLVGCILSGVLMLACGFVGRGEELVALRALQGVALALHLASSVALVSKTLPRGRGRNLAFACLGLSQPLGFSCGLVLGGVLVETVGWRSGWYLYGAINLVLSAVGLWSLPKSEPLGTLRDVFRSVTTKIDWLGTLLASMFMALLSYFLAFQEVQHLSALNAAIRILPSVVVGVALNFTTGLVVHKIPAIWLIVTTSVLTAGSPLLMALINPTWTYWTAAFFAQVLMPFSADVLFTVGLIVVTETFPEDKQAVAGSVFNAASQFGNAMGLAIMQVVSTLVTKQHSGRPAPEALLEGYRAAFWTMFAFMVLCAAIGGIGLRKAGRVGLKQD
ncbi:Ff.00g001630.m01.CDS01 [Fusarium sp. VM40]|nr:Ff.00g001630.m01.CDS01 [Fusarium sp. VM40]